MNIKSSKFLLLVLLVIKVFPAFAQTNSKWKIQDVAIKTKWAKDVSPENALPEYPRPQMVRMNLWKNLNGLWDYAISGNDKSEVSWSDRKILVPYPIESALSGVKKRLQPGDILWYRRYFDYKEDKKCRLLIHFGAVDYKATLLLNGKEIGTHEGGYTSFSFDITENCKAGLNEITVKVEDATDQGVGPHGKQVLNPSNIYYTPSSGIWQTVWIEKVPVTYIDNIILIPDIYKKGINLSVNLVDSGCNSDKNATEILQKKALLERYEAEVIVMKGSKVIASRKNKSNSEFFIPIEGARLWTPEDPFLYDLIIRVTKGDKLVDEVRSYFGMRNVSIQKDSQGISRIYLNNKYTYNLGVLDQGFWPEGLYTAPSDEALQFDIKAAKAMGFNTIRKHIKVEPARWYYHADKIGMLIWQDFVNPNQGLPPGAKAAFEMEVQSTIKQLYNFPCIVAWVVFNEKWGQYEQKRITEWVKKMDSTRLVNGHSGELLYVNDNLRSPAPNAYISSDMTDVHSYPFPRNPPLINGKVRVVGEFGGIGVPVEGHVWDDLQVGWGYDGIGDIKKLKLQYSQMIDSLVVLEKEGLSASIYTQPYDVESEQNGLMTYDRLVAKLPLDTIRKINRSLMRSIQNHESGRAEGWLMLDTVQGYNYAMERCKYDLENTDSMYLRSLAIHSESKGDKQLAYQVARQYIAGVRNPFCESNLKFIIHFTQKTSDIGFQILFDNIEKVNAVLGKDEAEKTLTTLIEREYISSRIKEIRRSDWEIIKNDISKYGLLGEETLLQSQTLYAVNNKDWELLAAVVKPWYDKYGSKRKWIGDELLNNIAWEIFIQYDDKSVLETGLRMSRQSIRKSQMPNMIDTYASLLYKMGEYSQAIEWEKKAVLFSDNEEEFTDRLNKMERGEVTWK